MCVGNDIRTETLKMTQAAAESPEMILGGNRALLVKVKSLSRPQGRLQGNFQRMMKGLRSYILMERCGKSQANPISVLAYPQNAIKIGKRLTLKLTSCILKRT